MSFWGKVFWACDPLNTITRQLLKTRHLTEMYMLWFHFQPWFKFYYHTLPYPKTKQINFKPRIKLNHNIYTWARNTVMWHWSAYTLTWQLSIDHYMDVQLIKLSKRRADVLRTILAEPKFLECFFNHGAPSSLRPFFNFTHVQAIDPLTIQ